MKRSRCLFRPQMIIALVLACITSLTAVLAATAGATLAEPYGGGTGSLPLDAITLANLKNAKANDTVVIDGYNYSGSMPTAVITVNPEEGRSGADIMPLGVITLANLKYAAKNDEVTIDSWAWVVADVQNKDGTTYVLLVTKNLQNSGNGSASYFSNSSSNYEGSLLQTRMTNYYNKLPTIRSMAVVPDLGVHSNYSAVSTPTSTMAQAAGQTKDIMFAMSRQDYQNWNRGVTSPLYSPLTTAAPTRAWSRTSRTSAELYGLIGPYAGLPGSYTGVEGGLHYMSGTLIGELPAVWVNAGALDECTVTVKCVDKDTKLPIGTDSTSTVVYGGTFTMNTYPSIAGYTFDNQWNEDLNAPKKTAPVSVANINSDKTVYLYYTKVPEPQHTVTVHYIDKANGNPIGSPTTKTYSVTIGNTFTLPNLDIQNIAGYNYKEWKIGSAGAVNTTLPVTVPNVASDTDVYLLYDKAAAANAKNAYINGASEAKNGTEGNPVLVALEDQIKYTITTDNITKPGVSGAKYDILFVLDWSQSMDIGWMYGEGTNTRTAREYELDVMLDMSDFITNKYPDSRVAVMAMNSTGFHGDLARTYLQYDTAFLTPSEYKNGGKAAMEIAFTEPWENPTEDPSTFLNAAIYKMQGVTVSLGSNAGGQKQIIPRTAPAGENLTDRIPVIVLISDFQIPEGQSILGSNYWTSSLKYQSNRFNTAYPAGILQTVRFDHLGNHTGLNAEYSTYKFDLLMENNVSPNGHSHWGFTKVNMGTPYAAALSTIKNDFVALAPPDSGQGTVITDEVPEGLEVDDISHEGVYDPDTRKITWDLYDEDEGEITVWFTATVKQKPQTFENTAEITFIDGSEIETNTTYHKAGQDVNVTVTKTVGGEHIDKSKSFEFYVYLISSDPLKPLESNKIFIVEGGIIPGSGATAPAYTTLTLTEDFKLTFSLKHGQTLTIKDIPSHLLISIEEKYDKNYQASFVDSKDGSKGDNIVEFRPAETDDGMRTFDFVNKLIYTPPMGVKDESWPMEAVLLTAMLAALAGITALTLLRRRKWTIR